MLTEAVSEGAISSAQTFLGRTNSSEALMLGSDSELVSMASANRQWWVDGLGPAFSAMCPGSSNSEQGDM